MKIKARIPPASRAEPLLVNMEVEMTAPNSTTTIPETRLSTSLPVTTLAASSQSNSGSFSVILGPELLMGPFSIILDFSTLQTLTSSLAPVCEAFHETVFRIISSRRLDDVLGLSILKSAKLSTIDLWGTPIRQLLRDEKKRRSRLGPFPCDSLLLRLLKIAEVTLYGWLDRGRQWWNLQHECASRGLIESQKFALSHILCSSSILSKVLGREYPPVGVQGVVRPQYGKAVLVEYPFLPEQYKMWTPECFGQAILFFIRSVRRLFLGSEISSDETESKWQESREMSEVRHRFVEHVLRIPSMEKRRAMLRFLRPHAVNPRDCITNIARCLLVNAAALDDVEFVDEGLREWKDLFVLKSALTRIVSRGVRGRNVVQYLIENHPDAFELRTWDSAGRTQDFTRLRDVLDDCVKSGGKGSRMRVARILLKAAVEERLTIDQLYGEGYVSTFLARVTTHFFIGGRRMPDGGVSLPHFWMWFFFFQRWVGEETLPGIHELEFSLMPMVEYQERREMPFWNAFCQKKAVREGISVAGEGVLVPSEAVEALVSNEGVF